MLVIYHLQALDSNRVFRNQLHYLKKATCRVLVRQF